VTWVKICGITNLEDALTAVDAGADALGFVFYDKSPRRINVETAREIVANLPTHVEKVGVLVGESQAGWVDLVLRTRLTAVQLYLARETDIQPKRRKATSAIVFQKPPKVFVALSVNQFLEEDEKEGKLLAGRLMELLQETSRGSPPFSNVTFDAYFLDSGGLQQPGGTGRTFDWHRVAPVIEEMTETGMKLVVAGGLTPENVGHAIVVLRPWGVDVSSGVEASPGKKDPDKVRAFVRAVRETDGK